MFLLLNLYIFKRFFLSLSSTEEKSVLTHCFDVIETKTCILCMNINNSDWLRGQYLFLILPGERV